MGRKKERWDFRKQAAVLVAVAIVVWLAVLLVGGDSGALAMFRVRDRHQELSAQVRALEAENARLREEIERLKSDPETIERLAREELGMARDGEDVILVQDAR